MAKKTLEEKIKDVAFWTVIFLVLYLILGYLLQSLWLSKPLMLDELYDLIKDGFSLTAALLAPAAAFVLFSDWRIQHVELKAEKLSEEIWAFNRRIIRRFYELHQTLESGRTNIFKKEKNIIQSDIDEVKVKIFSLGGHIDISIDCFVETGFKVNNKMTKVLESFDSIVEKIDESVKVVERESNNFTFYNSKLDVDWSSDLIELIASLDDLNHDLLKIGFTKKIKS